MIDPFSAVAWSSLFVASAEASSALLGLFFVAMSLRPAEIEHHAVVRGRARTNFQALAALIASSLMGLAPQPGAWLGIELIAIWAALSALVLSTSVRDLRRPGPAPSRIDGVVAVLGIGLSLLPITAGVSLLTGQGPGLYLLVPVVGLGYPYCVVNAWRVIFPPELARPTEHRAPARFGRASLRPR